MAIKTNRVAVIKLDDFEKTGSNGGIVVDICTENMIYPQYKNNKDYIFVKCSNECKPGWIYTSKTNILLDSNKPPV